AGSGNPLVKLGSSYQCEAEACEQRRLLGGDRRQQIERGSEVFHDVRERSSPFGLSGSGETMWNPSLSPLQARTVVVVSGNLCRMFDGSVGVHGFHPLRDLPVETCLPRPAQPLVQRVADQRVGE